jgi:alpha-L-rhamnosidase
MRSAVVPQPRVVDVRFEHRRDALGIGASRPRLSWIVEADQPDWMQAGYEVEARGSTRESDQETGLIESGESVLAPWPFAALQSRQRLAVRVRVRGVDGAESDWSVPVSVEAGLLEAGDWHAAFVTPGWPEDTSKPGPAPLLRKEFRAEPRVAQARLYVTALGVFEASINGVTVGDHVMDPGWTSYDRRLRYRTFDVTGLLREGANAICAMLGDGWHRGRLGWGGGRRNCYGDRVALLAQLEITYANGEAQRVVTDETWRAAQGPIRASDIYDGETYDARLERPGWDLAGYDDGEWSAVRSLERDLRTLVAPDGPPVRRIETLSPRAITTSPSGKTIVDFGQNLVGRLKFTVSGEGGQAITIRHAEELEDGELCLRPLRTAEATDRYILKGAAEETWEPRFTFHGFRYAEIDGWPGEVSLEAVRAVVCHSDMERTGWFECSDPIINRFHENTVWSMRGNFLDVPTDCPQRDERLGWTGDIQLFSPTACFLYDSAGFLTSWLADLAADQGADGAVPFVVPNVLMEPPVGAAGWSDAAVIVPWTLHQRYGDLRVLADQYDSIRAWVDHVTRLSGPELLWDRGFQFGDWLDPSAPPDDPAAARTDPCLVATAYFARSAALTGRIALALGRDTESAHYLSLAAKVRDTFARQFVTPAGRLLSDTPTAYALAIQFDLLPDPCQRARAGERLAQLVRESSYRISTGVLGTPVICDALCDTGQHDVAFRLFDERGCPSWLFPVTLGATTIWERWDSLRPDGSINPGAMTSFNHYALGSVADWLYRTVGGLAPAEAGYRRLVFQPRPSGNLTHAQVRHRTPYGTAACAWSIEGERIEVEITIPANTTATVNLPGSDAGSVEVGSGTHCWRYPYRPPTRRPAPSLDVALDYVYADPPAWSAVLGCLLAHAPGLMGEIVAAQRVDGAVTLRQIVSAAPRADEIGAALLRQLDRLRE